MPATTSFGRANRRSLPRREGLRIGRQYGAVEDLLHEPHASQSDGIAIDVAADDEVEGRLARRVSSFSQGGGDPCGVEAGGPAVQLGQSAKGRVGTRASTSSVP